MDNEMETIDKIAIIATLSCMAWILVLSALVFIGAL